MNQNKPYTNEQLTIGLQNIVELLELQSNQQVQIKSAMKSLIAILVNMTDKVYPGKEEKDGLMIRASLLALSWGMGMSEPPKEVNDLMKKAEKDWRESMS